MVASVDNKNIDDAGIYAPDSAFNAVFTLPHKAGVGDLGQQFRDLPDTRAEVGD